MNCTECARLILSEGGDTPSPGWQVEVASHVAGCAECRRVQADLAATLAAWKNDSAQVAIPEANLAWEEIRPLLGTRPAKRPRHRMAPLLWFSPPLAAAAAVFAFVILRPAPPVVSEDAQTAHADYLEAGNPTASTMVYVDKDSGWLVVWAADSGKSG